MRLEAHLIAYFGHFLATVEESIKVLATSIAQSSPSSQEDTESSQR